MKIIPLIVVLNHQIRLLLTHQLQHWLHQVLQAFLAVMRVDLFRYFHSRGSLQQLAHHLTEVQLDLFQLHLGVHWPIVWPLDFLSCHRTRTQRRYPHYLNRFRSLRPYLLT